MMTKNYGSRSQNGLATEDDIDNDDKQIKYQKCDRTGEQNEKEK